MQCLNAGSRYYFSIDNIPRCKDSLFVQNDVIKCGFSKEKKKSQQSGSDVGLQHALLLRLASMGNCDWMWTVLLAILRPNGMVYSSEQGRSGSN